jgi:hypothetical protein
VYLWVPEYQRLHWDDYCDQYGARGVPVYFVQDGWYRDNVMGRHWTPQQRSWSRDQWIEQDRIARDRWEHARWDRAQGGRTPDYRQPVQWQGSRGSQWAPQPSWQPQGRGESQRGAQPRPQPQWHDDRGHVPPPQWHDDPSRAPQQWNGTPVRNVSDRGRGDWQGHADGNPSRGGTPQPVGAWQSGVPSHGQAGYGAPQPPHGASAAPRPVQTAYNAGQNVPHDGSNRDRSNERDNAQVQGNERGQYQPHPVGYQNR